MHAPVLLKQVVQYLVHENRALLYRAPPGGHCIVDCTVGTGGHAAALLDHVHPSVRLLALDRDPASLAIARGNLARFGDRVTFAHTSYSNIVSALAAGGLPSRVAAVLVDCGLGSQQLDLPSRGFGFRSDGPLDMRFDASPPDFEALRGSSTATDPGIAADADADAGDYEDAAAAAAAAVIRPSPLSSSSSQTAGDIVSYWSIDRLAALFRDVGEEPLAAQIARAIGTWRGTGNRRRRVQSTLELRMLVEEAVQAAAAPTTVATASGDAAGYRRADKLGRWPTARTREKILRRLEERKPSHPDELRRVFQALRIAVNDELGQLPPLLSSLPSILAPYGRIAMLAFQPLEDAPIVAAFHQAASVCGAIEPGACGLGACHCAMLALRSEQGALNEPPATASVAAAAEVVATAAVAVPCTAYRVVTPVEGGVRAGKTEIEANRRSRSARLRVLERTCPASLPLTSEVHVHDASSGASSSESGTPGLSVADSGVVTGGAVADNGSHSTLALGGEVHFATWEAALSSAINTRVRALLPTLPPPASPLANSSSVSAASSWPCTSDSDRVGSVTVLSSAAAAGNRERPRANALDSWAREGGRAINGAADAAYPRVAALLRPNDNAHFGPRVTRESASDTARSVRPSMERPAPFIRGGARPREILDRATFTTRSNDGRSGGSAAPMRRTYSAVNDDAAAAIPRFTSQQHRGFPVTPAASANAAVLSDRARLVAPPRVPPVADVYSGGGGGAFRPRTDRTDDARTAESLRHSDRRIEFRRSSNSSGKGASLISEWRPRSSSARDDSNISSNTASAGRDSEWRPRSSGAHDDGNTSSSSASAGSERWPHSPRIAGDFSRSSRGDNRTILRRSVSSSSPAAASSDSPPYDRRRSGGDGDNDAYGSRFDRGSAGGSSTGGGFSNFTRSDRGSGSSRDFRRGDIRRAASSPDRWTVTRSGSSSGASSNDRADRWANGRGSSANGSSSSSNSSGPWSGRDGGTTSRSSSASSARNRAGSSFASSRRYFSSSSSYISSSVSHTRGISSRATNGADSQVGPRDGQSSARRVDSSGSGTNSSTRSHSRAPPPPVFSVADSTARGLPSSPSTASLSSSRADMRSSLRSVAGVAGRPNEGAKSSRATIPVSSSSGPPSPPQPPPSSLRVDRATVGGGDSLSRSAATTTTRKVPSSDCSSTSAPSALPSLPPLPPPRRTNSSSDVAATASLSPAEQMLALLREMRADHADVTAGTAAKTAPIHTGPSQTAQFQSTTTRPGGVLDGGDAPQRLPQQSQTRRGIRPSTIRRLYGDAAAEDEAEAALAAMAASLSAAAAASSSAHMPTTSMAIDDAWAETARRTTAPNGHQQQQRRSPVTERELRREALRAGVLAPSRHAQRSRTQQQQQQQHGADAESDVAAAAATVARMPSDAPPPRRRRSGVANRRHGGGGSSGTHDPDVTSAASAVAGWASGTGPHDSSLSQVEVDAMLAQLAESGADPEALGGVDVAGMVAGARGRAAGADDDGEGGGGADALREMARLEAEISALDTATSSRPRPFSGHPSSASALAAASADLGDAGDDADEEELGLPPGALERAMLKFRDDPFARELGSAFMSSGSSSSGGSGSAHASHRSALATSATASASDASREDEEGAADDDSDYDDDGRQQQQLSYADEPESLDRATFFAASSALGIDPYAIDPAALGLGSEADVAASWAEALEDVDLEVEGPSIDATDARGRVLTSQQRRAMVVARGLLAYLPPQVAATASASERARGGSDGVAVDWRAYVGLGVTLEGLLARAGLTETQLMTRRAADVQRAIRRALMQYKKA